jgi:YggT family protein
VGGYDWASLIGAFLIAFASVVIDVALTFNFAWPTVGLLSVLRVVEWIFYGFIGFIFLEVIFSWVNPHAPLAPFVHVLNDPLMRPLRRVIPLVGNIDLTPLVALILLRIVLQLVTELLIRLA